MYDLQYIVKMLPYVRSFCRSFVEQAADVTNAMNDHSLSPADLERFLLIKTARRTAWLLEMKSIGFEVCDEVKGCINVPLVHPHSRELVAACIDWQTLTEADILCHRLSEKCSTRRSVWKV